MSASIGRHRRADCTPQHRCTDTLTYSPEGQWWPKENSNGNRTIRSCRTGSTGMECRPKSRREKATEVTPDLGNSFLPRQGETHARSRRYLISQSTASCGAAIWSSSRSEPSSQVRKSVPVPWSSRKRHSGRPVQFEITADVRASLLGWNAEAELLKTFDDYVFPSRVDHSGHLSTRQYGRLVDEWATGNLRAIQILLGHTKIENTVRYLGVDIEDALELAEHTEI